MQASVAEPPSWWCVALQCVVRNRWTPICMGVSSAVLIWMLSAYGLSAAVQVDFGLAVVWVLVGLVASAVLISGIAAMIYAIYRYDLKVLYDFQENLRTDGETLWWLGIGTVVFNASWPVITYLFGTRAQATSWNEAFHQPVALVFSLPMALFVSVIGSVIIIFVIRVVALGVRCVRAECYDTARQLGSRSAISTDSAETAEPSRFALQPIPLQPDAP